MIGRGAAPQLGKSGNSVDAEPGVEERGEVLAGEAGGEGLEVGCRDRLPGLFGRPGPQDREEDVVADREA